MRKLVYFTLMLTTIVACNNDDEDANVSSDIDYKQKMREFVIGISSYAKTTHAQFIIIPQNGIELVTTSVVITK
jgi:cysteinyl-tRNA synthetase, unknown class